MTNTNNIEKKLNEILEATKKYESALEKNTRDIIREMVSDIMKEHPQVSGISWAQYTPWFNDGDPCVFRVHEPLVRFTDEFKKTISDSDSSLEEHPRVEAFYVYNSSDASEDIKKLHEKLANFYKVTKKISEGLDRTFGDHCLVTVTANGDILIDEYQHD